MTVRPEGQKSAFMSQAMQTVNICDKGCYEGVIDDQVSVSWLIGASGVASFSDIR
jgi:hypothetical protein